MPKSKPTTVNPEELAKFNALAGQWWNIDGEFKMLHRINPLRLKYIMRHITESFGNENFNNLHVLDIGSGGGLVAIPLAKLGLKVEGIDIAPDNVQVATLKAKDEGLRNVKFQCKSIESLASSKLSTKNKFDVIVAFEVMEHVDNLPLFIEQACSLLKDSGIFLLSTINRTLKSLLLAKITAEYIISVVPKGTHDWGKFITPQELNELMPESMCEVDYKGLKVNPLTNNCDFCEDLSINYFACFQKKEYA